MRFILVLAGIFVHTIPGYGQETLSLSAPATGFYAVTGSTVSSRDFLDVSSSTVPVRLFREKTSFDLFRKEYTYKGNNTPGPYGLPDKFVTPSSDIIFMQDAVKARDVDYSIEYEKGMITFANPISDTTTFKVRYECFPFDISDEYGGIKKKGEAGTAIGPLVPARKSVPGSGLRIGGAKTIGVSFGSGEGASIDQSLRVEASGRITEDVQIKLLLSDQNLPLQPEGTTAIIEEMDKVYFEVSSKNATATLGDYSVDFNDTEFAHYTKKLEGMKGNMIFAKGDATLFSALTGGGFATVQIQGQEGVQGPYDIMVGGQQVNILADTEHVWIDDGKTTKGLKAMTRGSENDYTIVYNPGSITFTRNQLITKDAKIVVDFEYSNEYYKRSTTGFRGRYNGLLEDKLSLGLSMFRESDNERASLFEMQEGDDKWKSLEEKTMEELSDLELKPPEKRTLIGMDFRSKPAGDASINGEIAYSIKDLNKLYKYDNKRDEGIIEDGIASKVDGSSSFDMRLGRLNLGNMGLAGSFRQQNADFFALGQELPTSYTDKWHLNRGGDRTEMSSVEGSARYQPFNYFYIKPGGGYMGRNVAGRRESKRAVRIEDMQLTVPGYPQLHYKFDDTRTYTGKTSSETARILRHDISTDYEFWKFKPEVSLKYEGSTEQISRNIVSAGRLSTREIDGFSASVERSFRWDDAIDKDLRFMNTKNRDWTNLYTCAVSPDRGRYFLSSFSFTQRSSENRQSKGSTFTNLANLKSKFQPKKFDRSVQTEFKYDLNNVLSTNPYTNNPEPSNTLSTSVQLGFYPVYVLPPSREVVKERTMHSKEAIYKLSQDKNRWLKRLLLNWSLDNNISLTEQTREQNNMDLIMLRNRRTPFEDEEKRVSDEVLRRHIFAFMPTNNDFSLTYELKNQDNNYRAAQFRKVRRDDDILTLKSAFIRNLTVRGIYKMSASTEVVRQLTDYSGVSSTCTWRRDRTYSVEANYQLSSVLRTSLKGEYINNTEKSRAEGKKYTLSPAISYAFRSAGKIEVSYNGSIERRTTLTREHRLNVNGNYKMGENVTASASYGVTAVPGLSLKHQFKAEVQLYF